MTILKTILFLSLLSYSSITFSQIDIKSNPVAWAFGEVGILAEYSLSERTSVQLGVSYGTNFQEHIRFQASDFNAYKTKGIKFTPSYRYYILPEDPTEGAYFDFFSLIESKKSVNIVASEVPVDMEGNLTTTYKANKYEDYLPYIIKYRKLGLGINYGYKFAYDSGFIFDFYFGPAFHLLNKETHEVPELYEYVTNKKNNFEKVSKFYFNFGAAIGWRF